MRVLHVITALHVGGAETMLLRLLRASQGRLPATHEVVSLTDRGEIGRRIEGLGIALHVVGMARRGIPDPLSIARLASIVARGRADVVQTWMYHADLLGGLAAAATGARLVWGIHHSTLDRADTPRLTRLTVAACARLSRWLPDAIVSVSGVGRDAHVAAGYDARKFVVIPNGFDLAEHQLDAAAREEVRRELGLTGREIVIGLVARFDPQKDHLNFLRAAALLARRRDAVRFLLCGHGASPDNDTLASAIAREGLAGRVLLLGRRNDVPRVMNALDVATLSSAHGEAFPLVIGEAMACGVPCVVTDVGDSALLVGDTGRVVQPRDPAALARAWEALVDLGAEDRRSMGAAARTRIAERFGIAKIAEDYHALYERVLSGAARPGAVTGEVAR